MAIYNMTFVDNSHNFIDLAAGVSTLTEGWLMIVFIIAFMLVMFVSMKKFETTTVFISVLSIGALMSILFMALGWLPWWFVVIPIVGLMAVILTKFVEN